MTTIFNYIIDDIMNDIDLKSEFDNNNINIHPRYFNQDSDFTLDCEVIPNLNLESVSEDIGLQKLKIS
jgi:hypothetical protein